MKNEIDLTNGEDLAAFITQHPEVRRVSVHRLDDQANRWIYIGSAAPQLITEEFIQMKYAGKHGGGMFAVKLHDEAGKITATKWTIPIGAPVDEVPAATSADTSHLRVMPAAQPFPTSTADPIELMREELRESRAMMREMINAFSKQQPAGNQSSIVELVTALTSLKKLEPAPAPQATDLFVKGMELAMKFNKGASGEGNGESTWLDFAREVLQETKPLLAKAFLPAAPAAAIEGETAEAGGDDQAELRNAIAFLKAQSAAGNSVALWVAYIMENVDAEVVKQIAAQPFQNFIAIDAELGTEPYKSWFLKLQGALRAAIQRDRDTPGAGGNEGDAPTNGGSGAGGESGSGATGKANGRGPGRRAAAH